MFSEDSESNLKAFELPPSVWELILSVCPAREVGEVRKALGESLVEQTCDLHEEVSVAVFVCSVPVYIYLALRQLYGVTGF